MTRVLLTYMIGLTFTICSAQTQNKINQDAAESYRQADQELDKVYGQILNEYKTDTTFIQNLKKSQRIWIKFRDAELKMKYPDRGPGHYGSIQPTCVAMYLEKLTKERIETLKQWTEGIEEGDLCTGSIKFKE